LWRDKQVLILKCAIDLGMALGFPGLAFTDDAAVLTAVFGLTSHIKPVHRAAAARAPGKEINKT
jgi:hypothetical protein